MSKEKIVAAIEKHRSFLLTSHINPDGDGIGSELALYHALKRLGKEVVIANKDALPADYDFLPGAEQIKTPQALEGSFEVLIVLDCGNLKRVGAFDPADFALTINIDHHYTNQSFGDLDWFLPEAACTGELVFELIGELGVAVDERIATCLYTALLTDTGSFRYANTRAQSFRLAARLLDCGADPAAVSSAVYERMSLARMRLLGEALKTLELHEQGKIASMVVSRAMFARCQAQPADTEDFVNYPRAIEGVRIALFLRELETDFYKGSLRSKVKVDVARVAEKFNGGGHFHAAGFRVRGRLPEVKRQIISELKAALEKTC